MTVGKRIHELRIEKNMSQKEFSTVLEISKSSIASYEREKQVPSASVIMSICDSFNIEPRWLLKGEGPKYADKAINSRADMLRHNKFMLDSDLKISEMEAEIARLKEEISIAELERDRAQAEAFRVLKESIKAAKNGTKLINPIHKLDK